MAPQPLCLLLLWSLALFLHGATSSCNVTCWTDYDVLLNCSCSGSVPTHPVQINVSCSNDGEEVHESCEVKPPQSWCIIQTELESVASVGSLCTATVLQAGDQGIMNSIDSSKWYLSDVVRPSPPFSVSVTSVDGFYNITWDHSSSLGDCQYNVRIRESNSMSQDPERIFRDLKAKYILLQREDLQMDYRVDVQAKMSPSFLMGPWSEWSSSAEWRTQTEEVNGIWWYVTLPIILVVALLLLGYLQKPFWQKRIQVITNIPKPNDFFKPLYHNYGGNFKEWVKPAFSEYDYLTIDSRVPMTSEKQHDILHWNNEKQNFGEDGEAKQGAQLLRMLQPHSNLLLHLQDGSSSQGTGHSTGHISIHTVTLSGEEFEEEVMSQSSMNTLRSYQDGESFGSFETDNRGHAGFNLGESQSSRMDMERELLPQRDNVIANHLSLENINFQPHVLFNEPERLSLDSFVSNEQSEDGYPHVDLDTIDSGFVECSSPGVTHSNTADQMDSDLFQEHTNSNSNYVKQWMVCRAVQEDSSPESELQGTQ